MLHPALGARRGLLSVQPGAGRGPRRRSATRAARCAARSKACAELGLDPIVGPELEFFLVVRDPAAPNGVRRHVDHLSMVYTVGPQADPGGLVRRMTEQLSHARPRGVRGQPRVHELPVRDQPAPLRRAATRPTAPSASRRAVKDIAAQNGLVATFMGKPFNDQGGSGTHLHISLNRDGANAFDDPRGRGRRQRRAACLHGRRARARRGADGAAQPDDQRLPAHPARLAGPDACQLGLGQPGLVHPHPARARRRHPRRDPRRRRRRQPVPGYRRGAARRRRGHAREAHPPAPGDRRRLPRRPRSHRPPLPASLDAALDALDERQPCCARAWAPRSCPRSRP